MTTEEKIAVMQACVDGKTIQICPSGRSNWSDTKIPPQWNWVDFNYRVKPEPREWWVVPNAWLFASRDIAEAHSINSKEIIHVREVLE